MGKSQRDKAVSSGKFTVRDWVIIFTTTAIVGVVSVLKLRYKWELLKAKDPRRGNALSKAEA